MRYLFVELALITVWLTFQFEVISTESVDKSPRIVNNFDLNDYHSFEEVIILGTWIGVWYKVFDVELLFETDMKFY